MTRGFQRGAEYMKTGRVMSREEIMAIPTANRRCLIDKGHIIVWPQPQGASQAVGDGTGVERHVVALGFGRFGVVEGRWLKDGMTKEEAYALAGKPVPEGRERKKKVVAN